MGRLKKLIKKPLKPLYERAKIYLNHYKDPLYREWYYKHSKRLLKFKDIHAGESCFIIGNGPSLNKMDLSVLKDYHTFGLNKIYLMFDKVDLNLSYHVAVNKYVIEQSIEHFKVLKCPSFVAYKKANHLVESYGSIYYILTGGTFSFQKDITDMIAEGGTVTYVAMQIAHFMGFQKVFLIGVDHNFTAEGKPNELQILKGADCNHFDPSYFGDQLWQLPDLQASEISYSIAKYYFERSGGSVYDATVDGKLNIFQKIGFDEALLMASKRMTDICV